MFSTLMLLFLDSRMMQASSSKAIKNTAITEMQNYAGMGRSGSQFQSSSVAAVSESGNVEETVKIKVFFSYVDAGALPPQQDILE